jgi:hypothetical protein
VRKRWENIPIQIRSAAGAPHSTANSCRPLLRYTPACLAANSFSKTSPATSNTIPAARADHRLSIAPGFAPLCGTGLLRPGCLYQELPAFFCGESPASLKGRAL